MGFDHGTLVWFSKSFGLFYLIGLSLLVVAYAYWPSNKKQFDRVAESIIRDEDKPWR
ncbi:MAG: CcoQ/FixQ family Cbb3-type cytochrome c oxidase assembly chaperone [Rhizobiales bacterium]|nr:CcoQ/FixQ family Cbb3-type cytochrome c oxidase assembly chaperone [Hyphomicrobiales bacterium]